MSFESVPVGSWSSRVSSLKNVLRKKGQKSSRQLAIEQQEANLSQDLMEKGVDRRLNCMENSLAQKRKSSFPIHGTFTEVFLLRQNLLIEQACRANEQTSVKDICHLSPIHPVVPSCSACCAWARICPRNC